TAERPRAGGPLLGHGPTLGRYLWAAQGVACSLDRDAAILDVEQPGFLGDLTSFCGNDAELQPQRLGADGYGLTRDVGGVRRWAEHVDELDLIRNRGERAID